MLLFIHTPNRTLALVLFRLIRVIREQCFRFGTSGTEAVLPVAEKQKPPLATKCNLGHPYLRNEFQAGDRILIEKQIRSIGIHNWYFYKP